MARPPDLSELVNTRPPAPRRPRASAEEPPAQRSSPSPAAEPVTRYGPESEVPLGEAAPAHGVEPEIEPEIESARSPASVPIGRGEAGQELIIGSGDRAHHLALAPGVGHSVLRAPRPLRGREGRSAPEPGEPLIARSPPGSRADCRRRCGLGACCDPASELGCGGLHCAGGRYATL